MSQSFDINQFNLLVSQASDALMCDADCQTQRQSDQLKQIYLDSQANAASASYQEQTAQKNYVVFSQGQPAYDESQDEKFHNQAKLISDKFIANFNEEATKIKSQFETYNGLFLNITNVSDLFLKYKKENIELIQELKDETNDVLTNDRKTFYQDQKIDDLKFYYFYFLLTIYVICVICFGVFSLLYPSQSSFVVRLAIFIGLIILPFLSSWILGIIVYLAYKVYNLLPKNVYKGSNLSPSISPN